MNYEAKKDSLPYQLSVMLNTPDIDPKSYFWLKKYFENNCDVQAKTHKIYVMAMLQRRYNAIYPNKTKSIS